MNEYNRGSLGIEDPPEPDFLKNTDLVDLEKLEGEDMLTFKENSLRTLLNNDPSRMGAESLLAEIDNLRNGLGKKPYKTFENFKAGMTVLN